MGGTFKRSLWVHDLTTAGHFLFRPEGADRYANDKPLRRADVWAASGDGRMGIAYSDRSDGRGA
jgi:hypothetical protein